MTKRFIRAFLVAISFFAATQCCVAMEQTNQEKFANAVSLMGEKKFADALPILEDLGKTYPTASVYWNIGLSAAAIGNYDEALDAWLKYRREMPGNWQGRAKLVQAYQALGKLPERDRERADLVALWQANTDARLSAQQMFCREEFMQDDRKVMALEYFNPSGPFMVVYSFVVLDNTGKPEYKVSLGSYDSTNQVALELGQRPKDKRLYHLDLYRGNVHQTFGFYLGKPGYDDIRKAAADAISGKIKPVSGSTMSTTSAP